MNTPGNQSLGGTHTSEMFVIHSPGNVPPGEQLLPQGGEREDVGDENNNESPAENMYNNPMMDSPSLKRANNIQASDPFGGRINFQPQNNINVILSSNTGQTQHHSSSNTSHVPTANSVDHNSGPQQRHRGFGGSRRTSNEGVGSSTATTAPVPPRPLPQAPGGKKKDEDKKSNPRGLSASIEV